MILATDTFGKLLELWRERGPPPSAPLIGLPTVTLVALCYRVAQQSTAAKWLPCLPSTRTTGTSRPRVPVSQM